MIGRDPRALIQVGWRAGEDALPRPAAQLEPAGGWRPEQMSARFDELARRVVAFRARTGPDAAARGRSR
jgi:hypothetical protein